MASPATLALRNRPAPVASEHKKAMTIWPAAAGTLVKREGPKLSRRQKRVAKAERRSTL